MPKKQDKPTAIIPLTNRGVAWATNFKMIGDLTPERELWWACYGAALELAHEDWDRRLPRGRRP